jgi:hypothetical protein
MTDLAKAAQWYKAVKHATKRREEAFGFSASNHPSDLYWDLQFLMYFQIHCLV